MKNHIPNFVTLLNLIAGCFSIVFAFSQQLEAAAWMILLAAVFDFADGLAARLLNARSEVGKMLDSLADIISFGLAPGIIVYQLMIQSDHLSELMINGYLILPFTAFLLPAHGALRLASFSVDDSQEEVFKGLAIPANAILFASLPLILQQYGEYSTIGGIILNFWTLFSLVVISSLLMVSNIPMFSLKLKNLKLKENKILFSFMIISLLLLIFLKFLAVPFIILVYLLMSLIWTRRAH